jgi:hypothetical protein
MEVSFVVEGSQLPPGLAPSGSFIPSQLASIKVFPPLFSSRRLVAFLLLYEGKSIDIMDAVMGSRRDGVAAMPVVLAIHSLQG